MWITFSHADAYQTRVAGECYEREYSEDRELSCRSHLDPVTHAVCAITAETSGCIERGRDDDGLRIRL